MNLLQMLRPTTNNRQLSRRLNQGLAIALAMGLVVVFLLRFRYEGYLTGLVWAGACVALGALVGFLFGIPRTPATIIVTQANVAAIGNRVDVAPQPDEETPAEEPPAEPPAASTPHVERESNLEQISDWVTKLLVGGSLTQLQDIPNHFLNWGGNLAIGLIGSGTTLPPHPAFEAARAIATGLIIYFLILGFFGGYLITVLQLRSGLAPHDANP